MVTDASPPAADHFFQLIHRQERGRLKVYIGSNAGVGKTYAMLREANRLRGQGINVVADLVETHDRDEIGDLEVIPAQQVAYQGLAVRELDVDAVLARRPTVCLVDELAHTDTPGSRQSKRYQDVSELLRDGIHVITTVNIQHLESLYDEVERVTGVKVMERSPDSIVGAVDQIIHVDMFTEDLLKRMRTGKIDPPERAERALEHLFTPCNLTRLRELTLEEMPT